MDPTLLMIDRADRPDRPLEAETLTVEHDGAQVVLRLDDGTELRADRVELHTATASPTAVREAA